jgi:hypothetical protein
MESLMESFDVYFFFNSIRFNKKELYKASVIKKSNVPSHTYNVVVDDRLLQNYYGAFNIVKKDNQWKLDYLGDIDFFNLKIEISKAIEMYESYSSEYIRD